MTTQDPGAGSGLNDVVALSARNAWAVGSYFTGSTFLTLFEHWNGTAWRRVRSPSLGSDDNLYSVAASSAGNIWAVGFYATSNGSRPLALHCC